MKILVNCPAECDASNGAVTGLGIAILTVRFSVAVGAAAGADAGARGETLDGGPPWLSESSPPPSCLKIASP